MFIIKMALHAFAKREGEISNKHSLFERNANGIKEKARQTIQIMHQNDTKIEHHEVRHHKIHYKIKQSINELKACRLADKTLFSPPKKQYQK